jgi:rubrerythrin
MKAKGPESITSVEEFLAHALALETESAERYRELADSMEVHNNEAVARLFVQLSEYGEEHVREVCDRARGLELPEISPWDYKWTCPEGPESTCVDEVHYLMTTCDALKIALHNEIRGRDFYAQVAAESPDRAVRAIAAEMIEEEDEHVDLLNAWIARTPADECTIPQEDLDPPNTPE